MAEHLSDYTIVELEGLRSLRVGRGHRLIYRHTETEIQLIDSGPRGDLYKR